MGRRKIVIEKIKDDKTRQVTFLKRKKGLLKKARELAVLCDCNIEVIIFGNNGQLYEFSSQAPGEIFDRYSNYRGISEVWTADGVSILSTLDRSSNLLVCPHCAHSRTFSHLFSRRMTRGRKST
mmetsp:Transcript_20791/g.84647  ORF Transcript_20791/g.84647 Transcript_20791/m.84647 type:complete len:124 (+) Transcript_20791:599-970(+)